MRATDAPRRASRSGGEHHDRIDADRLDRGWFLERFAWQGRSEAHFDRLHRRWPEIKRRIAQEWRELRQGPTASMTEGERFYRQCPAAVGARLPRGALWALASRAASPASATQAPRAPTGR